MLDAFPRTPLAAVSPTPVEPMDRLGEALGLDAGRLWVKRDDVNGVGGGGNKVRKLEFLIGDALAQGCDTLVTGGGRQSNHCRITAAAAARLGLACTIVLTSPRPSVPTGNVLLDEVLRPDIVWAGSATTTAPRPPSRRRARASRPRVASPTGCPSAARPPSVPWGTSPAVSSWTRSSTTSRWPSPPTDRAAPTPGLVAGLGSHGRVLGVDVGTRPDLDERVPEKAAEVAELAGLAAPTGLVQLDHDRFGPGYGAPTEECREALHLAATLEGLLLDPVYTGKAMAGLVAAAREGRLPDDGRLVFVHTGGTPALFAHAYADWIRSYSP